jgi:16S rRNA (cytosine967-C5)-methyltransferase
VNFIHQHIQSAKKIIEQYKGEIPLAAYLKNYFSANKKFGSKDRKNIAHLCFCFYRLGKSLVEIDIETRIKIALFLCDENEKWNELFEEEWIAFAEKDSQVKIGFITEKFPSFNPTHIFLWKNELSKSIDTTVFQLSHLIQPDLFLRIRPNKEKIVVQKLNENNIAFNQLSSTCLALQNASKIDTVLSIDEEVTIQDYSSQRIAEFLQLITYNSKLKTWDCCAASGGKSIVAFDVLQNIQLTVSDVRSSIIQNLKNRFAKAGIRNYQSLIVDLVHGPWSMVHGLFDLIICDAPCSGSGTWGRTPEQLYFFDEKKIEYYSTLQQKIVSNTIPNLTNGGYFLYITCSVFQKENEEVVEFIQQQFSSLQLIKQELLIGYNKKADTMFTALFKKAE